MKERVNIEKCTGTKVVILILLTLFMLVSAADNLCKRARIQTV